jgi:23S rRNA (cytidine2498-2'-O)-methyltransferase
VSPGRPTPAGSLTGFVAVVGFEAALLAELGLARADGPRWPGLVTTRSPVTLDDPAFALQVLPAAIQVTGASIEALAVAADAAVGARLEAGTGAIALHVYVPDRLSYRTIAGRAALLERAFLEQLQRHRPRVRQRVVVAGTAAATGSELVAQLALVGRTSLLVSVAAARRLPAGGTDVAPFVAGTAAVAEDRTAPSRAYRKLVEGFAWLGQAPRAGETCVDLGGSPGGWAHTVINAGARVIAVDRAPLAPALLKHPALTMVIGNAFTYRPPAPVDWLLCDVICAPDKTIALVARWIDDGWCKNVVATLKFKGAGDYAAIGDARVRLGAMGWATMRIKHLRNHSNEAVILMSRGG